MMFASKNHSYQGHSSGYLFIVINKKIGGERKMTWDEILEWIKEMIRI